jgi:hypothetical protein
MDMMRQCMEWMMSLGWASMFLGVLLLAALVVLILLVSRQTWRGSRS